MSNSVETAIKPYIGDREIAGQNKNIGLWEKWYKGYDPDFHDYTSYTGTKEVIRKRRKHLPANKIICEAWANLLLNEKTDFNMGDADKKKLDLLFKKGHFWSKANALVEKSFALGIGAFELSLKNLAADKESGRVRGTEKTKVKVSCINGTKVYPITIEDGDIVECAFATSNTQSSYITIHLIDEETGNYKIKTLFFKDKDFKNLEKETEFDTESDLPWFKCIYPNVVNNEDVNESEKGVSIFANHIDQLKAIDVKYDLFDTEFKQGKKKTIISTKLQKYGTDGELIKTLEGTEDDVFFVPQGDDGKNLVQRDTTDLRTQQCVEALNAELSMLGYACGFGKGFLTFNAEAAGRPLQTATAVMMMNNDLFRTTKKHEIVIEQALSGIIEAIVYASNKYTNDKFSENATEKLEIKFDDSIFEDKEAEKNSARTDLQNGVMSEVEYRVKFYAETEEEAKKKLRENPAYVAKMLNALLPAAQSKLITPKDLVLAVWFEEDAEKIKYIQDAIDQQSQIDAKELMDDEEMKKPGEE